MCYEKKNRCVFNIFLKLTMFRAFLMPIGRVFHNEAAAVSIRRLPYFTVLFLLGVNSVSFTDNKILEY